MKFIGKLLLTLVIILGIIFVGCKIYDKIQYTVYPTDYAELVEKYSAEYGVDKYLIYAVIKCESGFDKNAVSSIGAKGLMQMTDDTFEWIQKKEGVKEPLSPDSLFTPEISIHYGVSLLCRNLEEFGNVKTAVCAYHAGSSAVRSWLDTPEYSKDGKTLTEIPYEDTNSYASRVIKVQNTYKNLYGEDNG